MIFFILIANAVAECIEKHYFTDCREDGTREVFVDWQGECTGKAAQSFRVDCEFPCDSGTFLGVFEGELACKACPKGTYSLGGSVMYGKEGALWSDILKKLINTCSVAYGVKNEADCSPWSIHENTLISGDSPSPGIYSATLKVQARLIKKGYMNVIYRKETFTGDEGISTFSILINKKTQLTDSSMKANLWKSEKFELDPGFYEFSFKYLKSGGISSKQQARISKILITGTKFADEVCYNCHSGIHSLSADSCEMCDFNQYLEKEICQSCPDIYYSYQGSVGESSCILRNACTEIDYKAVYTPCIFGIRNITYEWKSPLFCNFLNFTLPSDLISQPCEKCIEGFYEAIVYNETICKTCEDGQYFEKQEEKGFCKDCGVGTYAEKLLVFDRWDELPEGFQTLCIQNDGSICNYSIGWLAKQSYLTTGKHLKVGTHLHLSYEANVTNFQGELITSYEGLDLNKGFFEIYVDKKLRFNSELSVSSIFLSKGRHSISWLYYQLKDSDSEFKITSIKIKGSSLGIAFACEKCPQGYISTSKSDSCQPCDPGFSSDPNNTNCISCLESSSNPNSGGSCQPCPNGMVATQNKTGCFVDDFLKLDNSSAKNYFIHAFSDTSLNSSQFPNACSTLSSQLYCYQTFYGPLRSSQEEFYLSVLNSSTLQVQETEYYYEPRSGYAFAIVPKVSLGEIIEDESSCNSSERTIINLGSKVSAIQSHDLGFQITYVNGDSCPVNSSKFSSSVSFFCDKSAELGWPVLSNSTPCSYSFSWHSKYACPVCLYSELATLEGDCNEGHRHMRKTEPSHCIIPYQRDMEWDETCTPSISFLLSRIFFIVLVIIFILGCISFIIFLRERKKYSLILNQDSQ